MEPYIKTLSRVSLVLLPFLLTKCSPSQSETTDNPEITDEPETIEDINNFSVELPNYDIDIPYFDIFNNYSELLIDGYDENFHLDTDADGLPDEYEKLVKLDLNNQDSDYDGFSDGDEVTIYQSNPNFFNLTSEDGTPMDIITTMKSDESTENYIDMTVNLPPIPKDYSPTIRIIETNVQSINNNTFQIRTNVGGESENAQGDFTVSINTDVLNTVLESIVDRTGPIQQDSMLIYFYHDPGNDSFIVTNFTTHLEKDSNPYAITKHIGFPVTRNNTQLNNTLDLYLNNEGKLKDELTTLETRGLSSDLFTEDMNREELINIFFSGALIEEISATSSINHLLLEILNENATEEDYSKDDDNVLYLTEEAFNRILNDYKDGYFPNGFPGDNTLTGTIPILGEYEDYKSLTYVQEFTQRMLKGEIPPLVRISLPE